MARPLASRARWEGSVRMSVEQSDSRPNDRDATGRSPAGWVATTALLILAWSLPAALNVAMDLLFGDGPGARGEIWRRTLAVALPWYVWAAFTPAVRRLVRDRPLRRPVSAMSIAAHLTLCAEVTLAFVLARRLVRHAVGLSLGRAGLVASAFGW